MGVYKRPQCEWKNGKPTWYVQFRYKKVRHYDGIFATRREALEAEQYTLNELKRSRNSKRNRSIPKQYASFNQLLPKFIDHRMIHRAERTADGERRLGMKLSKRFGKMGIRNISAADIEAYVAQRKSDNKKSRTINLEICFFRNLYRYAVKYGYAENNPALEVEYLPKDADKEEVWIPSDKELLRFIKAAGETTSGKFIVPWLWFLAYTGTRSSESLFMEWQDIDFEKKQINIYPKLGNPIKNRRKRYLPLHPELELVLLEWRKDWELLVGKHCRRFNKEKHDWVFINPSRHGERLQSFRRSFNEARKNAGLEKMTPHTLRHYFVSSCIMNDPPIPIFVTARWCGHSNSTMIHSTYGHLLDDYTSQQMNGLKIAGIQGKGQ